MFQYIRKLLLSAFVCVNLLPVCAEGTTDVVTIVTEDASSVDTLIYGCQRFGRSGTYANIPYGDDTRTLDYTIYQRSSSDKQEATINLGDTIIFGCRQIAPEVPGTVVYYDTVPENGYERILQLTLHTLALECDTARFAYEESINEGDTLLFGCQLLWEEGEYTETFRKDDNSCDSIVTLTLSFLPPVPVECDTAFGAIEVSIYEGDTLLFGCQQLTKEGVYKDKLSKTDNSCDSIVTLTLSFLPPVPVECDTAFGAIEVGIYEGDTLLFGCQQLTKEGVYKDKLRKADNSCDSIVTLTLSFLPPIPLECDTAFDTVRISIFEGDTLLFFCQQLTDEGEYREVLRKADNSCDSIVTLELSYLQDYDSVRAYIYDTVYDAVCLGSTYTISGIDFIVNADTTVNDTIVDYLPMQVDEVEHQHIYTDSVATYIISVLLSNDTTLQDSIELGQTYTFKGEELTPSEAGVLELLDTVPNMHGCDSVITLELKVIAVEELRDTVPGAEIDTAVCVGTTFTAVSNKPIINQDTIVTDTLWAVRQVKDDILHTLTTIDSVVTYNVVAWLLSDTTLQDSIELGQIYTFKGEELTPSEVGVLELLDTVPNMHGCDSVITLELKVIAVEELHEYVQGAVQDTLCAGASYTAGSKTLTVDGEIVVTDTVFAVRQAKDDILHTLTYTDSVTTYTLLTWNDELNLAEELDWGHAFCGMAYNGAEGVLNALREAIEDDDLFRKDTTLAILYKNESGTYVPYDGIEMSPDRQELSLRAEVSNSCSTLTYDKVLTVEKPDYELSDEFADLPAVSKYNDWLLLVDVDSLNKVYGLYPEADSVRWYKISGAAPDIDNDELVGTGYYYTDDRHLVGYYYAIVTLPVQTDECGGEWRTRIVVRTNGGAPLTIAPNIVRVGTPVYLYHLLTDEISTLYIYAADGRCVQTLTHQPSADNQDGIATIATKNMSPGVYTVRVTSSSQKAALRFIITQ